MRRFFALVLAASALGALAAPFAGARAELPPLIPREVIFGNPEKAGPQMSPDGTRLAYLKPDEKNVLQVWVKTIGQDDDRQMTRDRKRGITQYFWAYNKKDLLYLQDNDGDENFHLYAVDLSTAETRDLTPVLGVRAIPIGGVPEMPEQMIVALNRRTRALFDPWRVDLNTGALTQLAENPGNYTGWLVDAECRVRGALAAKPEGGGEFVVRDTEDSPWRTVAAFGIDDEYVPLGFSKDGKTVHVSTNVGRDTRGLHTLDLATGKLSLVAAEEGVDAGAVMIHPVRRTLEAVSFNRDRVTWKVLDPSVAKDFEGLARVSPGEMSVTNRDLADRTWLVVYSADRAPLRYYSWDRAAEKATFLFAARPKLEEYTLAPMKPVDIRSRDGLTLHSYLTLPVGIPAKKLPMVLYVHGGPWARDAWGYEPYAQWLANRGYAVLQVNYRGSTGFGKKFRNAAKKEFAGKMHDDLIDAVNWAVEEGIADPSKVAIFGGSYGGYATLVGLTFTPDVFACGVDIVGPSNLVSLIESFPPYWRVGFANGWYPFVGNPDVPEDRKDMEARSPLFKVDRLKAPLLIGQGANDPRVTQKESDQMVEALKKRGVEVEYLVFPDEGHGFARPENRLKFNAAAERFLAKHLGGRAEPEAEGSSEKVSGPGR